MFFSFSLAIPYVFYTVHVNLEKDYPIKNLEGDEKQINREKEIENSSCKILGNIVYLKRNII
jgi:hypothetical protein